MPSYADRYGRRTVSSRDRDGFSSTSDALTGLRPTVPRGSPLEADDPGGPAAVRMVDGLPLFTITAYTAAQQEMIEVFAGKAAIVGHEIGQRRYCFTPLPGATAGDPPKRHIRRHRCPLIDFNGRVRLIEHNGDLILLDPVGLD